MPRARSPKRDEAYKIWIDSCGKKKLKDIASDLGVSETQIRKWKNLDKWNSNVTNQSKGNVTKRKRGGQPGNHNATGPPGNKNAEKFGFFSKYLPEETVSIIQEMPTDPLDILWHEIQIAYAAIIRAQQIMYVRDRKDKTIEKVEKKLGNVIGEKWLVSKMGMLLVKSGKYSRPGISMQTSFRHRQGQCQTSVGAFVSMMTCYINGGILPRMNRKPGLSR